MGQGWAVVTGASGGIGLEFAHVLAEKGYDLVLVARSEGKLQALAQELQGKHRIQVKVIALDLGQPQAAQDLYDTLQAQGIATDVLINNAGFATYGHFATETSLEQELQMIQLNIATLTHLTKLFVQPMVQRKRGRIVNVASTASFQPGPLMAVYYASKAYVLSFSEALAQELQGTGVTVTALCPGPTESGFQERAAMTDSKLVQSGLMTARAVVEQGVAGMLAGKAIVVPGFSNKLGTLLPRLMPRGFVARMVMRIQERTGH
jgi:uncharacterized protein